MISTGIASHNSLPRDAYSFETIMPNYFNLVVFSSILCKTGPAKGNDRIRHLNREPISCTILSILFLHYTQVCESHISSMILHEFCSLFTLIKGSEIELSCIITKSFLNSLLPVF